MAKLFREIPADKVQEALTLYLKSLSVIDDDQEVTYFKKIVGGLEVKVEKVND